MQIPVTENRTARASCAKRDGTAGPDAAKTRLRRVTTKTSPSPESISMLRMTKGGIALLHLVYTSEDQKYRYFAYVIAETSISQTL